MKGGGTMKQRRNWYAILSILLLLTEVYIALYVRDTFVRPYLGDVLVVILIGCLVRIVFPNGVRLLPVYVFGFAAVVEGLQYIDIVRLLGWENNTFLSILIGRSFAVEDLVCYAAGCLVLFGVDVALRRWTHC